MIAGFRLAAVVLVGFLTACAAPSPDARLPPAPPEVEVTMAEYQFGHAAIVPRGRVVFRVRNEGELEHAITLVALTEDMPPIAEQLRGDERRGVPSVARLTDRAPGESGFFAADLAPGRYGLLCFVLGSDRKSHAVKGMASEFRVR
jgi:uncharacterized cupredoxin-like copper-binding protein